MNDRMTSQSFPARLWALACSLKLAITLSTAATLLIMGGSLVMHFNPALFGPMDREIMGLWLPWAWAQSPGLTWWVPLSGLCLALLGLNTLCCIIDWLTRLRTRWRKTGEYLIHAGFALLVIAYAWGNLAGFRSGPHKLFPGETMELPQRPGYALRLEEFAPRFAPTGQPLDMINRVALLHHDQVVAQAEIRFNHPLMHNGLVILPTSLGQALTGFRFHLSGRGMIHLAEGSRLTLDDGTTLTVTRLLADARRNTRGTVFPVGEHLGNPALLLTMKAPGRMPAQEWYFLREPLPSALAEVGALLRPVEPIHSFYSLLTINHDPGARVALTGSLCLSIGVVLAFFSFYRKRSRGDRPEI